METEARRTIRRAIDTLHESTGTVMGMNDEAKVLDMLSDTAREYLIQDMPEHVKAFLLGEPLEVSVDTKEIRGLMRGVLGQVRDQLIIMLNHQLTGDPAVDELFPDQMNLRLRDEIKELKERLGVLERKMEKIYR